MNNPIQELLKLATKDQLYPPNSRYHGLDTKQLETADGKKIIYLARRFVPSPERFALVQEHTAVEGERLDNLAATYFGDPALYWRLCDANNALNPEELTQTVGQTLRITLPEGMPGNTNG
jgi:hypothetical protein